MYEIYFWHNIFITEKTFFGIGMYRHVWLLKQEIKNIFSLCPQGVKTAGHIDTTTHQSYVILQYCECRPDLL
jgi:hypothetical protein